MDELRRKPNSQRGLRYLTDAVRTSQTTDLDHAHQAALDAATVFRESGSRAGKFMAEFQASYADQLAHQLASCLTETRARVDPCGREITRGSVPSSLWKPRFAPGCRRIGSPARLQSLEARKVASLRLPRTPRNELPNRTLSVHGGHRNSLEIFIRWACSLLGRRLSPHARLRFYIGLDAVAEETEQWYLDAQILQEASRFIADDSDFELRAAELHRLANALVLTGDFQRRKRALRKPEPYFSALRTDREGEFLVESQISLAKLDLLRSRPDAAARRLEPLRGQNIAYRIEAWFSNIRAYSVSPTSHSAPPTQHVKNSATQSGSSTFP